MSHMAHLQDLLFQKHICLMAASLLAGTLFITMPHYQSTTSHTAACRKWAASLTATIFCHVKPIRPHHDALPSSAVCMQCGCRTTFHKCMKGTASASGSSHELRQLCSIGLHQPPTTPQPYQFRHKRGGLCARPSPRVSQCIKTFRRFRRSRCIVLCR